jgi:bifunctional non-homologous end joining protein LigD
VPARRTSAAPKAASAAVTVSKAASAAVTPTKAAPAALTATKAAPAAAAASSVARPRTTARRAGSADPLATYRAKRDFTRTPEPPPELAASAGQLQFFIQRHAASRLHYDFRLESDGVLKSWAVPKGPSLDPAEKRLAVQVEDHPLDYGSFEGTIPAGEYGAGDVLLWDRGTWTPLHDVASGLQKGKLHFELHGEKLNGEFVLFRLAREEKNWILRKLGDAFARDGDGEGVLVARPESVARHDSAGARWHSSAKRAAAADAAPARGRASKAAGPARAKRAPLPALVLPQLASTAAAAPKDDGWVYEVKYDGYRMLARIDAGAVKIVSRNGQDWTAKLQPLARQLAALPVQDAWLDGEITVPTADGISSFQALQQALDTAPERIHYFVFDLAWLDGEDLREAPLAQRHQRLAALLRKGGERLLPAVSLSEQLEGDGKAAWQAACKLGLEGLIGKRLDASYVSGRTRQWIKLKCRREQEFVIGGYTAPRGSREKFGALLVGVQAPQGGLIYAGRVGTGFDDAMLARLHKKLERLATDRCPFVKPPKLPGASAVQWIKPQLVAQVQFAEWTAEDQLRQAAFIGLREDKDPRSVVREDQVTPPDASAGAATRATALKRGTGSGKEGSKGDGAGGGASGGARGGARSGARSGTSIRNVTISNPARLVYAEPPLSKLDVARYYDAVAEHLIVHVQDRPLAMVRCPQGTTGTCFFQKHISTRLPPGVRNVTVQEKDGPDDLYVAITEPTGIVALAQHGVIEMHPWGSRLPKLGEPDRLTMDLDPDDDVPWPTVIEAALLTRTLLEELGLKAYVKTTGGKGLHVVSALKPTRDWTSVKGFARGIALHLTRLAPKRFTAELAKASRGGKIFIDYLRNGEGATAVAALSLRARPGAPVSMPLDWSDLKPKIDLRFAYFNLKNAPAAAAHGVQAWADFSKSARAISARAMKAMGG